MVMRYQKKNNNKCKIIIDTPLNTQLSFYPLTLSNL